MGYTSSGSHSLKSLKVIEDFFSTFLYGKLTHDVTKIDDVDYSSAIVHVESQRQ